VPVPMEEVLSDYFITLTGRGVCLRDDDEGSVFIDAFLDGVSEGQMEAVRTYLAGLIAQRNLPPETTPEITDVPEENWMSVFRSQHQPVRVSERLVVRPAWCDPVSGKDLVVDPGMAFGTGSHETTRMCLELLDQVFGGRVFDRMFDLGTGSGILAIAGARLGAGEVLAVDTDPIAVDVARENIRTNGFNGVVRVKEGSIERADGHYDLITANLSGSLLVRLAGEIAKLLTPGGFLIASGIMTEERPSVLAAFSRAALTSVRVVEEKSWVAGLLSHQLHDG